MKKLLLLTLILLTLPASALAARPSQGTAERTAYWAVVNLCGGPRGLMCVKRYPVTVFYDCGPNSVCWHQCYTHVERYWFGIKQHDRCSGGRIAYRRGKLISSREWNW